MSSKEKLLASAQKNLQKGQLAKAVKDYQQVVDLDPKDIRNRQKLAELFCRARMNAEALGEYGAVARHYGDNGFYLKAIAVYKQMQKLDPEKIDIYHRLAELNVKQGLVGNALAEYRNLLAFFEKKKLLADAIGVLQKMAELEPENLNIHIKIAECYAQAGLREKAREEFTQILVLLGEAREFSRMARLYEIFLPLFPNDPEMKAGLAEVLIRQGEVAKGLQLLKSLLRDNPENSRILKALAFGYRQSEDFENARLTFQHLLKQVPGDLELREGYIRACLDGGEHRRALEEIEEWKEAFLDAGKVPVLKVFYENLLEVFPGNEQIQGALSLVYEQTGEEGQMLDSIAVSESPAEPVPAAEYAASELPAKLMPEPVAMEASIAAPAAPAPSAEQIDADEEGGEAEEIPLEFLEAAADFGEPLSAPPSAEAAEELPQVEIAPEMGAEEMELELELELEEPLLAVAAGPDEQPRTVVADVASQAEAIPAELDPEVILEELEPEEVLEELEAEEVLEELEELEEFEELEPAAILEEPEEGPAPEPRDSLATAAVTAVVEAGEGLSGLELGELLSDIEAVVGPAKEVRDELEEAEFYLQQGLLDDAERVCRQLLESDPRCAAAQAKLAELAALRQEAGSPPAEYQLFSLPVETRHEEPPQAPEERMSLDETDRIDLDGVFDEFKIGVETPIDIEDTETHYNLGIAYKEMGLLDDAVAEFDKAMKNPVRLADSLTLKGTCLFEKGTFDQAEEVFKNGLAYPDLNPAERTSLHYEMGLLYEAWDRPLEALDSFQSAADADPFFRNVGEKVEALRKTIGLDAGDGKEETGAKGNKSRVSYV